MGSECRTPETIQDSELARLIMDFSRRILIHHGIWFSEVDHHLGLEAAIASESSMWQAGLPIWERRLVTYLGTDLSEGFQVTIMAFDRDIKLTLLDDLAKNWLALDGVWFQAVERLAGMDAAKRCNDTCWFRFSYIEAKHILTLLKRQDDGGVEALAEALNFRLYARLNKQSTTRTGENVIDFEMNDCRVQSARKRRGLPDYPCKSAGLVEYSRFAQGVDSRIQTECVGCPPDAHPDEWYCKWRFRV